MSNRRKLRLDPTIAGELTWAVPYIEPMRIIDEPLFADDLLPQTWLQRALDRAIDAQPAPRQPASIVLGPEDLPYPAGYLFAPSPTYDAVAAELGIDPCRDAATRGASRLRFEAAMGRVQAEISLASEARRFVTMSLTATA
jgi:hypothetical protein